MSAPSTADLRAVLAGLSLADNAAGGINPLEYLPCGNCDVSTSWVCPEVGTRPCSVCHLVSYCSKSCQEKHWSFHKHDCKDPFLSPLWQPAWMTQSRKPSFVNNNSHSDNLDARRKYGLQKHLWGNMPAVDILKLAKNEGVKRKNLDLKLAFIASGDLRDLIHTVNEMPQNYSGKLTVLLNDKDPIVTVRNLLILLILGREVDKARAAELALHLWYSAFVQASHAAAVMSLVLSVIEDLRKPIFSFKLGQNSTMSGAFSPNSLGATLMTLLLSKYDFEQAQQEYQRVFLSPEREDLRDRRLVDMEPSHRLALDNFRRFGLLLPFGAPNAHFTQPNRFLFSKDCQWLQYDGADPFESWDVHAVLAAGKAHGVHRADLFGSLYFYLSDQFRIFADRIQRFNVSFHMLNHDASDVPAGILRGAFEGAGLPRNVLFDRIDASNVIDQNYMGISSVLSLWGPLLNRGNKYATLFGYFMNWIMFEQGASVTSMPPEEMAKFVCSRMDNCQISLATILSKPHREDIFQVLYDNSPAFVNYLNKLDTSRNAQGANLKLKQKHTILPHRLFARLEDSSDAVPYLPDEDSWYLKVYMSGHSFVGRAVEFGPP